MFIYSEQHVEFWPSRQSTDDSDSSKLSKRILLHNPFRNKCPNHVLINIASGLVDDDKNNCVNAKDVGEKLLSLIAGSSFGKLQIPRRKKKSLEVIFLHALFWNYSATYGDICLRYVRFVQKWYSPC